MEKIKIVVGLFLFVFFQSLLINAQERGIIRGKVHDASTGETLIGATVMVKGTTTGTTTDFDGNYELRLAPGSYTIQISFISYETVEYSDVQVTVGNVAILDTKLGESTEAIDEVVIAQRARQKTEASFQVMQKKSASLLDGISTEQISKLGDSDAAAALKRVTGISVQDGKYVFVRGLGDRYTKITLNGAEIPGLDPEKNTVQMDIFPSNVIENIVVHKTFTPDLPGESTGGHVDIITKDFPEKLNLMFSSSFGYNPQANLSNSFLSYPGGSTDWLAIDNGTRDIPVEAQQAMDRLIAEDLGAIQPGLFTTEELNKISSSFKPSFSPQYKNSFLNQSHKFGLGNQVPVLGNKSLGYNIVLNYSHDFEYYDDGVFTKHKDPNTTATPAPHETLSDEKGTENTIIAGLINLNLKLNNNHKIGLKYMRNQSARNMARYREGYYNYEQTNKQDRNLAYLQRSFNNVQLSGKHVIPVGTNLIIDWFSSYTLMEQNEPDLRFWVNLIDSVQNPPYRLMTNDRPIRYYRTMSEVNFDNKINFELPVVIFNPSKLKFGAAYLLKERDLDDANFKLSYNQYFYDGDIQRYLEERLISPSLSTSQGAYYYYADHNSNLINSYEASQSVMAEYIMVDVQATTKLRIVTGTRIEQSHTFVENKVDKEHNRYKKGGHDYNDFLPSLNATYTLIDNMNLRVAATRTIARPVFREIGTNYYDYKTSFFWEGNPDLKRTSILNLDLRWEYFFKPGEKVALSTFYKKFTDPIEPILSIKTSNFKMLYYNLDDANILGYELEFAKKLNFIEATKDFTVGGNLTLVKSEVVKPDSVYLNDLSGDPNASKTRPMYGQAPWILNLFLGYENTNLNIASNLGFNISGEKIIIVNQSGTPYVYEQPYPSLNWNISKGIQRFTIEAAVKNIFDSEYKAVYPYTLAGDKIYSSYHTGRIYSLSIKYLLD